MCGFCLSMQMRLREQQATHASSRDVLVSLRSRRWSVGFSQVTCVSAAPSVCRGGNNVRPCLPLTRTQQINLAHHIYKMPQLHSQQRQHESLTTGACDETSPPVLPLHFPQTEGSYHSFLLAFTGNRPLAGIRQLERRKAKGEQRMLRAIADNSCHDFGPIILGI